MRHILTAKVRVIKPQLTITSPPYEKEAGIGVEAGRGRGFDVNEITRCTGLRHFV